MATRPPSTRSTSGVRVARAPAMQGSGRQLRRCLSHGRQEDDFAEPFGSQTRRHRLHPPTRDGRGKHGSGDLIDEGFADRAKKHSWARFLRPVPSCLSTGKRWSGARLGSPEWLGRRRRKRLRHGPRQGSRAHDLVIRRPVREPPAVHRRPRHRLHTRSPPVLWIKLTYFAPKDTRCPATRERKTLPLA